MAQVIVGTAESTKPSEAAKQATSVRLTYEQFCLRAISALRKPPYKGIHSVYSGFNEAFRAYFNEDPVKWTNQLAKEGKIEVAPTKGGVRMHLPGEGSDNRTNVPELLARIVG